jgi:hypothetical protein
MSRGHAEKRRALALASRMSLPYKFSECVSVPVKGRFFKKYLPTSHDFCLQKHGTHALAYSSQPSTSKNSRHYM